MATSLRLPAPTATGPPRAEPTAISPRSTSPPPASPPVRQGPPARPPRTVRPRRPAKLKTATRILARQGRQTSTLKRSRDPTAKLPAVPAPLGPTPAARALPGLPRNGRVRPDREPGVQALPIPVRIVRFPTGQEQPSLSVAREGLRGPTPPAAASPARVAPGQAVSLPTSPSQEAVHLGLDQAVRLNRIPWARPSGPSVAMLAKAPSLPVRHAQPQAPALARQAPGRRARPAGSPSRATEAPTSLPPAPVPSPGPGAPPNPATRASRAARSGRARPAEKDAASKATLLLAVVVGGF